MIQYSGPPVPKTYVLHTERGEIFVEIPNESHPILELTKNESGRMTVRETNCFLPVTLDEKVSVVYKCELVQGRRATLALAFEKQGTKPALLVEIPFHIIREGTYTELDSF